MANYTQYAKNPTALILLENGNYRYEYSTTPVKRSNVDDTIVGYRPCVRWCHKLIGGSTCHDEYMSVEQANKHYLDALTKGFKKVEKRSWA